jgi:hypothetical protein
MSTVRGRILAGCALLAAAIAGCGGSSGGTGSGAAATGSDPTGSPEAAVRAWYVAVAGARPADACALMTAAGRRRVEVGVSGGCRETLSRVPQVPRLTGVRPTGGTGNLALAVARFGAANRLAVAAARRQGGRWLVDLPGQFPVAASVRARGVPGSLRESLPSAGAETSAVLGAAGRWVDQRVASGELGRVHVANAVVVGRVALAYLLPGSDVGGAGAASTENVQALVLVGEGGAWRVIGLA